MGTLLGLIALTLAALFLAGLRRPRKYRVTEQETEVDGYEGHATQVKP